MAGWACHDTVKCIVTWKQEDRQGDGSRYKVCIMTRGKA